MKNYFLDMDGTLAIFPDSCGETGDKTYKTKVGFFKKLKPYKNINLVNEAIDKKSDRVFILSNSPTMQADLDKFSWLEKFLPAVKKDNIIFNRGGLTAKLTKPQVVKFALGRKLTEDDILIDDSLSNLSDWITAGGTGILKKTKGKIAEWEGKSVFRLSELARVLTT